MRRLSCQACGHDVFFDSTLCVGCGLDLGYAPHQGEMLAMADGAWQLGTNEFKACANRADVSCNWLTLPGQRLCLACRHNRMIPDLSVAGHAALWTRIEAAKRVLFYSLLAWDLPRPTKQDDPDSGLAFDFLADEAHADGTVRTHLTGHASGLITINIAEGDDAERERRRTQMGEPYRTLVGHFRHEIGHYYWERLVATDAATLNACRALFGDDREDYAAALARHYEHGAPPDWAASHISTYATTHPWEDFAETFAHYVHMVDGLETAAAFGVKTGTHDLAAEDASAAPYTTGEAAELSADWVPVTVAVNAVNRSMGQPDLYPFVLSPAVNLKLAFIHDLLRGAHTRPG